MRRLISGDIRRILCKIGFYILPVLYYGISLIDIGESSMDFDDLFMSIELTYKYIYPFVVGIPVFLGVYADELKAGAMQTAIGRGLSRRKIALSKFMDLVILTAVLYLIAALAETMNFRIYMITPTALQVLRVAMVMTASFMKTVGAMAFAAIFVYLSWNASLGLIVELISLAFAEMILNWIQEHIKIPVMDLSYMGQVDQTCANFAAGANWVLPFCVVIAYVTFFNLIAIVVFGRKELDL